MSQHHNAVAIAPHLASLAAFAEQATDVAARAKHLADSLNVELARQTLAEVFPQHTLAVFSQRLDEEDAVRLIQILSDSPDVADLDGTDDNPDTGPKLAFLAPDHVRAVYAAEHLIRQIGTAYQILTHLEPGESEHEGWTEFQLPLRSSTATANL